MSRLLARGKTNKEIADLLGISVRTVHNHVAHIFDKLGVHSRSGAAIWLMEHDFVKLMGRSAIPTERVEDAHADAGHVRTRDRGCAGLRAGKVWCIDDTSLMTR